MRRLVLVIDNEQNVLDVFSEILESLGYRAMTTSQGPDALKILENHRVDLVIVDLVLPESGGLRILEKLRSNNYDVPVIFTAGVNPNEIGIHLAEWETCDFIKKPFTIEDVSRKLEKCFGDKTAVCPA